MEKTSQVRTDTCGHLAMGLGQDQGDNERKSNSEVSWARPASLYQVECPRFSQQQAK